MVDCAAFLGDYSDFRDGLLPLERRSEVEAHLRSCESCARYDRVIGGGIRIFQSLGEIDPDAGFRDRLLRRVHELDEPAPTHTSGASLAVTTMICAVIGASAWLPTLQRTDEPVRLAPAVAHAPYHHFAPGLFAGSRFLNPAGSLEFQPQFYGRGALIDFTSRATTFASRLESDHFPAR